MRPVRTALVVAALAFAGACAKHDESRVGADLSSAGHALTNVAADAAHDPGLKQAAAELKAAGHDLGRDTKKAAAEAKAAAKEIGAEAKHTAHDATKGDDN